MKDILKIAIFALALIGLVTLIIHLHWLGAIGVLGIIWNDIKPTSEACERIVTKVEEWTNNKKKDSNG